MVGAQVGLEHGRRTGAGWSQGQLMNQFVSPHRSLLGSFEE